MFRRGSFSRNPWLNFPLVTTHIAVRGCVYGYCLICTLALFLDFYCCGGRMLFEIGHVLLGIFVLELRKLDKFRNRVNNVQVTVFLLCIICHKF
jgi:hypothetical protein